MLVFTTNATFFHRTQATELRPLELRATCDAPKTTHVSESWHFDWTENFVTEDAKLFTDHIFP